MRLSKPLLAIVFIIRVVVFMIALVVSNFGTWGLVTAAALMALMTVPPPSE